MKTITLQNVEKLIFLDSKLRKLLPVFKDSFTSWSLSQADPTLKPLGQKALIEVVNQLKDEHLKILSDYFKEEVQVEKITSNVATHVDMSIYDAENYLKSKTILKEAMFAYREDEQIYLSIWR